MGGGTIQCGAASVNDRTRYDSAVRFLVFSAVLMVCACGGHPPPPSRGVLEADLGDWKFRRYQPVLDVEVWVERNKARAFTASYVDNEAENRGRVSDQDVVSAFVTRYEKNDGIVRETVRLVRRLASEQGYTVDESERGGGQAFTITGAGEAWVMWPAQNHVVKVGGRGRTTVPESIVASYADRYPSRLPKNALDGPLPGGPDGSNGPNGPARKADDAAPYDPDSPRPNLDTYDPKRVKLPAARKAEPVEE